MTRYWLISILFHLGFFFYIIPAAAQELPEGQILKSVYFGGGSYYVDPVQMEEIYEFIESIPDIYQYHITIHSHTDNIGGAYYNQWLSEQRGNAVIEKLLEKAIPEELIQTRDFGMFNPIYDNNSWVGRLKNRRVDIIFWPIVM